MNKSFDIAKDCMVCGKRIGHRGFCSEKCHNEFYDDQSKLSEIDKRPKKFSKLEKRLYNKVYNKCLKDVENLIKERKKTLRFEVKLYKDEQRGDREIELDYLLEELKEMKR